MEYTPRQIAEVTGVKLRTIRLWAARKLVPAPQGRGVGTRYTEEHRFMVRVVRALVAQSRDLEVVRQRIAEHTREELAELIGEGAEKKVSQTTEPEREASGAEIAKPVPGEPPLPQGPRWVIVELLPNLALMVGEDAAPLVRRVAAEICREYGRG